jgi:uncharacterized protein (DUF433 family)
VVPLDRAGGTRKRRKVGAMNGRQEVASSAGSCDSGAMSVAVLDRELYTVPEAARILKVPPSTLRWWLDGRQHHPPVLRASRTDSPNVTWGEFVEAGFVREYRRRDVKLQRLREFIESMREKLGTPYPLAHSRPFVGAGPRLMLEAQEEAGLAVPIVFEYGTGQIVMDGLIKGFVEKVDFSHEGSRWAERIHPLGRKSPVVIDPALAFGSPNVQGVRTSVIAELVSAGEPEEEVASDFGLSVTAVRQAAAFEWTKVAA